MLTFCDWTRLVSPPLTTIYSRRNRTYYIYKDVNSDLFFEHWRLNKQLKIDFDCSIVSVIFHVLREKQKRKQRKLHVQQYELFIFNLGMTDEVKKMADETNRNISVGSRIYHKLFAKFKNGESELADKPPCGRQQDFESDDLQALLNDGLNQSTLELSENIGVDPWKSERWVYLVKKYNKINFFSTLIV